MPNSIKLHEHTEFFIRSWKRHIVKPTCHKKIVIFPLFFALSFLTLPFPFFDWRQSLQSSAVTIINQFLTQRIHFDNLNMTYHHTLDVCLICHFSISHFTLFAYVCNHVNWSRNIIHPHPIFLFKLLEQPYLTTAMWLSIVNQTPQFQNISEGILCILNKVVCEWWYSILSNIESTG